MKLGILKNSRNLLISVPSMLAVNNEAAKSMNWSLESTPNQFYDTLEAVPSSFNAEELLHQKQVIETGCERLKRNIFASFVRNFNQFVLRNFRGFKERNFREKYFIRLFFSHRAGKFRNLQERLFGLRYFLQSVCQLLTNKHSFRFKRNSIRLSF